MCISDFHHLLHPQWEKISTRPMRRCIIVCAACFAQDVSINPDHQSNKGNVFFLKEKKNDRMVHYFLFTKPRILMFCCISRCHRGTGGHPRPGQADGPGGEDSRDQRRGSGLHPAGAGRHPPGQEEVSDRSPPSFKLL